MAVGPRPKANQSCMVVGSLIPAWDSKAKFVLQEKKSTIPIAVISFLFFLLVLSWTQEKNSVERPYPLIRDSCYTVTEPC